APGRAQAWRPAVPPWAHPARRSRAPGPVRRLPAPPAARAAPARPARAGAPAGRQAAAGCATSWATPEGRISDRAPGAGFVDYAGAFAPRSGDHASAPLQEAGRVDRLAVAAQLEIQRRSALAAGTAHRGDRVAAAHGRAGPLE